MNLRRNISRRRMIEGASAAALVTAAAATVPAAMASPEAASSGPGLPKGNWRIDTHAHYSPDVYNDYLKRYGLLGAITGAYGPWSVERHLAFMDQYRIQASVLSFGDLQVTVGPVDDRRATARAVNDYAYDLVQSRGDRFGIFAVTPMPDLDGSVAEVDRALGELDLDGICLLTNYKGTYLGDPSLKPLYEILNDRGAYVYVHPTGPENNPAPKLCFGPDIPAGNNVFEYTFDATRAMTSLIYNGVLRDYPNIRWHFTHSGGALPFLAYRLATRHSAFPPFNEVLPEGPLTYLKRMYFDDAQAFTAAQLQPLSSLVPDSHIMFGSDWPATRHLYAADNAETMPFLKGSLPNLNAGDPEPTVEEIYNRRQRIALERTNALQQFPKLKARIRRAGSR
ncbi:amidohydrolase [Streptomyces sp. HC44]|uniref:Amidohydrolase n=1 Tax=Streptomyces scabichelini TaxID=2711217 RepID=A0A6G4V2U7_9ACTN|nr:amidohydrolase family protein [Streptomyces scabichelini]NGO08326.1 amidohydrolase [Streptomyces scabichelini]